MRSWVAVLDTVDPQWDDQETLDGLLQELDQRLTSLSILDRRIERRGGITRAGNPRLRRSLVESAQRYSRPIRHGHAIRKGWELAPDWAVQMAPRAERRLGSCFRAIAARKHGNLAKVAVARELVGFLWAALLQEQESRT